MRVRQLLWSRNGVGTPNYETAVIDCQRDVTVQVTESPTGRSVQVHVLDRNGWRKVYP